ncbi:MAG: hypothetical protein A2015_11055 [Spirochaetes bacterium GWF1_31_7]|nr:MAG: hypothetical protein A2Y30_02290 [Spirochaetes bacterium GWE1_32_154]OHD46363.1 MAG: hypothetical protein A2Y29_04150 [Spirochaetes bacterium GWE2_31_10]OHD47742.1 MAG: hypothetical protein A2015_11055 [Spirochaetes bacterium GWF1_31_7]HBD93558.1 hypothetical protein [Spirochaetia bacterium]HBI37498.1 hypothetical protein [Spirochaetia bacterium]
MKLIKKTGTLICTTIFVLSLFIQCTMPVNNEKSDTPQSDNKPTLTPRYNTRLSDHCLGYYEYLPEGYDPVDKNKEYPLIIYIHGVGESGVGNTDELGKLLLSGPLYEFQKGNLPASFTVNNEEFSFIIISPQFFSDNSVKEWHFGIFPTEVDDIVEYMKSHYNVDESRIYLTGSSMGGARSLTYVAYSSDYGRKIAAMVPIASYIDEAYPTHYIDATEAASIAASELPIWMIHHTGDYISNVAWVNNLYSKLIGMTPEPVLTLIDENTHDGWSKAYSGELKLNGYNLYEWLLLHNR